MAKIIDETYGNEKLAACLKKAALSFSIQSYISCKLKMFECPVVL
jgi:hypothetical protein